MRLFHLFLFIVVLTAGSLPPVFAQKSRTDELLDRFSRYRQFTMAQGLANNTVRSIAQDDDGFLWFGTEEGLSRFDGERFTTIYHNPDGPGLPNNYISQLIALPGHRLLVGTRHGLCVLHTRSLHFEPVPLSTRPEDLPGDLIIWKLVQVRDGHIWVGTGTAVHLLDAELQVVDSYIGLQASGKPVPDYFVRDIVELPGGMIALKASADNN